MPEKCPNCESGYVAIEPHPFFWHGVLVKAVEVGWCRSCDFVWVIPVAEILPTPSRARLEAA